jgi:hypothetical protein
MVFYIRQPNGAPLILEGSRFGLCGLVFTTEEHAADWIHEGTVDSVTTPYGRQQLIDAYKRSGCNQVTWNLRWGGDWWRAPLRPLSDLEERR